MQIIKSTPASDGFRMPGEYEKHKGTVLIWPVRPGSWTNAGREAKETYKLLATAISESETVYMLCDKEHMDEVNTVFQDNENVRVFCIPTDDSWARDMGPTCVVSDKLVRGINWSFNAWGGDYDGLYKNYARDDAAAALICEALNLDYYDAVPFVLEGGSIHSDGEGTVIVTESCLLSPGRNPGLSKQEIEDKLKTYLGAQKVIWLPYGIIGDETNEHVDNVCAFVRPGEVLLAWTDDEGDEQWAASNADLKVLLSEKDAKGRSFTVHKMLLPKKPVCINETEAAALTYEEGEDMREAGERLAASYVNFYITNGGIMLPQFGDENDALAAALLEKLFPERKIYPIYARSIIVGGGNFHCITQQIPEV